MTMTMKGQKRPSRLGAVLRNFLADPMATVAVLLAVFGYALGTYAAYVTGILLRGLAG